MLDLPITISVVIPAYNEEDTLPLCLESIRRQSYPPIEIIIVDDGSHDKTVEIAKAAGAQVIQQQHQGPGTARNRGVDKACGDIILFLDADIIAEEYLFERLTAPIRNGEYRGTNWFDEMVYNPESRISQNWNIAHNLPFDRRCPVDYDEHNNKLYRAITKKAFLELGGFDVSRGIQDDQLPPIDGDYVPMIKGAICYHRNYDSWQEVWQSSVWIGKGEVAVDQSGWRWINKLIRYCFPRSLLAGTYKAIKFRRFDYLLFKIYFDFGVTWGIIKGKLFRKYAK